MNVATNANGDFLDEQGNVISANQALQKSGYSGSLASFLEKYATKKNVDTLKSFFGPAPDVGKVDINAPRDTGDVKILGMNKWVALGVGIGLIAGITYGIIVLSKKT